jgi:MoxR-like ATPase
MLTKFTEPSEILGPIDIALLKEGRYVRRTSGMLPDCRVAFLDEIFKSNSAILNTLLTILNERKFYQDGQPTPVRLVMLFAATNDIPEQSELEAMADRFILKVETQAGEGPTLRGADRRGGDERGVSRERAEAVGARGGVAGRLLEVQALHGPELRSVARAGRDRELWFPRPVFAEMRRIVRALETEDKVMVSDRKLVKLYRVIRAQAFLNHGGAVQHADLGLLAYVGNRRDELPVVASKVKALLGLGAGV